MVSFRLSLGRSERSPSFLGPSERGINSPSSRVACCSLILCFPPTSCCSSFHHLYVTPIIKPLFCPATVPSYTGTLLLRRPKLFPWDLNINTSENSLCSTSNKWLRALYQRASISPFNLAEAYNTFIPSDIDLFLLFILCLEHLCLPIFLDNKNRPSFV